MWGSRAVKRLVCGEVSFMLILLRLVKTIYTPYTVILAYHTIQHVEHCQLATLGGGGERASGKWYYEIVPHAGCKLGGHVLIRVWFHLASILLQCHRFIVLFLLHLCT